MSNSALVHMDHFSKWTNKAELFLNEVDGLHKRWWRTHQTIQAFIIVVLLSIYVVSAYSQSHANHFGIKLLKFPQSPDDHKFVCISARVRITLGFRVRLSAVKRSPLKLKT